MSTFQELFTRKRKIVNERPKGMSFEQYKQVRTDQKEWLRNRRKGFLVYKAVEIFTKEFENKKGEKEEQQFRRTYVPFVGDASTLKPI